MAFSPQPAIAPQPERPLRPLDDLPRKTHSAPMIEQSLWKNRNFRLLFASASATNLGDGLIAVAVPWLATLLTHDPFLIGLVVGARRLPWFLLSLPAGVITDRFEHRSILLAADSLRVLLSLALMVLAMTATAGTVPVLLMAALTFALGSAEVLRDNTAQTFLPSVVEKSQLERANGALWSTEQLTGQFIGPPLAGLLIGLSVGFPFAAQSLMLVAAIVLIFNMALPKPAQTTPHLPMLAALKQGMLWLWRDHDLRRLAFVLGGFNFVGCAFSVVLVLYCQTVLRLDAFGYGLFLTLAAMGGLAATVIGPNIVRRIGPKSTVVLGMFGFSFAASILALGAPLWLVAIVMVIDGFTGMLWNLAQVSYRQRHIPAPLLGRVNAAFRFIGTGPEAFGALSFGWLIAWAQRGAQPMTEPQAVLLPFAVAALVGGGLSLYAAFKLRLD
jgi:MFS family permease